MLATGRALMSKPSVLLLDEPTNGLAPIIVQELTRILAALNKGGQTILLVEQNVRVALAVADYVYVIRTGEIVMEAPATKLSDIRTRCSGVPGLIPEGAGATRSPPRQPSAEGPGLAGRVALVTGGTRRHRPRGSCRTGGARRPRGGGRIGLPADPSAVEAPTANRLPSRCHVKPK